MNFNLLKNDLFLYLLLLREKIKKNQKPVFSMYKNLYATILLYQKTYDLWTCSLRHETKRTLLKFKGDQFTYVKLIVMLLYSLTY